MSFCHCSDFVPAVEYSTNRASAVGHVSASPSALSSLLIDTELDESGSTCHRIRSDNYLILHQKDIENRIGVDNVRKWIDAMNRSAGSDSDYQKALDKLSDRELFSLVRSRHIQAPADVSRYLSGIIDDAENVLRRRDSLIRENAELLAARGSAGDSSAGESSEK